MLATRGQDTIGLGILDYLECQEGFHESANQCSHPLTPDTIIYLHDPMHVS